MPSPPIFGDDDYTQAMLNLLPRGRVWRRDPDSVVANVLGALAPTYTRSTASALQLLTDTLPTTTLNLLPEWEASLGLPDPCTPLNPTMEQRRAAVAAKWAARGGQTVDYYIDVAAALGFPITITELGPHEWQINASNINLSYFTAGVSVAGDPLWTVGNTELECRIRQIMPAHTVVTFNYS